MGSDTGAFAYGDYDQDDKEADEIYAKVEDTMDERRKARLSRLWLPPAVSAFLAHFGLR